MRVVAHRLIEDFFEFESDGRVRDDLIAADRDALFVKSFFLVSCVADRPDSSVLEERQKLLGRQFFRTQIDNGAIPVRELLAEFVNDLYFVSEKLDRLLQLGTPEQIVLKDQDLHVNQDGRTPKSRQVLLGHGDHTYGLVRRTFENA